MIVALRLSANLEQEPTIGSSRTYERTVLPEPATSYINRLHPKVKIVRLVWTYVFHEAT